MGSTDKRQESEGRYRSASPDPRADDDPGLDRLARAAAMGLSRFPTDAAMLGSVIEFIPADWRSVLVDALADPSIASLEAFVAGERARHEVYPAADDVFAALRFTPFASVRAVILGQDPYHQPDTLSHATAWTSQRFSRR